MSALLDPLNDGPMLQLLRADVAAARTASASLLPDGLDTRWRVIYTDSEGPTGIAPVCTAEGVDDQHAVITDSPGGPAPDPDGVYDCCPDPQIEIGSIPLAAYLAALLNADAAAAETGDAPASALPTAEWLLTPDTLAAIDDLIDRDGVFAKGYYERISDSTVVTGLRIGSGPDRVVARFGDMILRHADATYSVRRAVVETKPGAQPVEDHAEPLTADQAARAEQHSHQVPEAAIALDDEPPGRHILGHDRRTCGSDDHTHTQGCPETPSTPGTTRADILAGLHAAEATTIGDETPESLLDRHDAAVRTAALAEAADAVGRMLVDEPVGTRASVLYDTLTRLRIALPCTCARCGLHSRGCPRYVPGHELASPAARLARCRDQARAAALVDTEAVRDA